MKNLLMIVTAISVLAMGSAAVYAFGGGKDAHRGHNPDKMLKKMSRRLDLNETQQQQLKVIIEKQGDGSKADWQRLKELRGEARKISSSGDPSGSQARKVANEIGEITADMAYKRMSMMSEFSGILTVEQRQKLEEMTAKRLKRFKERQEKYGKKQGAKNSEKED